MSSGCGINAFHRLFDRSDNLGMPIFVLFACFSQQFSIMIDSVLFANGQQAKQPNIIYYGLKRDAAGNILS